PVQLPDRDLLHVSHCHTSRVHRQAMGPLFEKRPVAVPRSFPCEVIVPLGASRDASPIGSIEAKLPAAAGGSRIQTSRTSSAETENPGWAASWAAAGRRRYDNPSTSAH